MNKQEVMESLREETGYQVRQVEAPRVMLDGDRVYIRPTRHARPVQVETKAIDTLLRITGITTTLKKRLPPDLFAKVATYSFDRSDNRYALVVRGDQVADIVPADERHSIPVEKALTTIERSAGDGVDFQRALVLPGHVIRVEAVGIEEQPVRRGDLVRAGVLTQFSTIGAGKPMVQSYCQRLACTNGAVTMDVFREFSFGGNGGSNGQFWSWFRKSVQDSFHSLGDIVNRWKSMVEEQISPAERNLVLEALLKRAGIRGRDADVVRARALESPPENAYDMLNLVTWATSHQLEGPRAIVRAQLAAATFSDESEHQRVCPTCHKTR